MRDKDQFVVVSAPSSGSSLIWKRFVDVYTTDYFYMSAHYYDAACFKSKRKVAFKGFGIF